MNAPQMMSTMGDNSSSASPAAVSWNPTTPSMLTFTRSKEKGMCRLPANETVNVATTVNYDTKFGDFEASTILELLDARSIHDGLGNEEKDLLQLSRMYRSILQSYLEGRNPDNTMADDGNTSEVLLIMETFMHLCEVFFYGCQNESVTSGLVRFLRMKLLEPIEELDRILESDEPEIEDSNDENSHLTPFWHAVRQLCVRGYTMDAWSVLSYHSLCRSDDPELVEGFALLRKLMESAPLPGGIQGSHDLEEKSSYAQIDDLRSVIGSASKSRKGHDWDSNFYSAESHWAEWAQFVNHASSGAGRNRSDNSSLSKLLNVVPQIKSCVLQVLNGTASPESHSHWSEALLVELLYKNPSIPAENVSRRAETYIHMYHDLDNEGKTMKCLLENILQIMQFDAGSAVLSLNSFALERSSVDTASSLCHVLTALLCDLMYLSGSITEDSHEMNIHQELLVSASEVCMDQFYPHDNFVAARIIVRLLLMPTSGVPTSYFSLPSMRCTMVLHEYLSHYIPRTDHAVVDLLNLLQTEVDRICAIDVAERNWEPLQMIIFILYEIQCHLCHSRASFLSSDGRPGGFTFWLLRGAAKEFAANSFARLDNQNSFAVDASSSCACILASYCQRISSDLLTAVVRTSLFDHSDDIFELLAVDRGESASHETQIFAEKAEGSVVRRSELLSCANEIVSAVQEFDFDMLEKTGNKSFENGLNILGSNVNVAFDFLACVTKLTKSLDEENYADVATVVTSVLADCICPNDGQQTFNENTDSVHTMALDDRSNDVLLPIAHRDTWLNIYILFFLISTRTVNAKNEEEDNSKLLDNSTAASVLEACDVHVLMEKFLWLTGSLEPLHLSFQRTLEVVLVGDNATVDWQQCCGAWIHTMREVMGRALMHAFVLQNIALKRELTAGKASASTSGCGMDDEVKQMLISPAFHV